jgi:hypothetical protein
MSGKEDSTQRLSIVFFMKSRCRYTHITDYLTNGEIANLLLRITEAQGTKEVLRLTTGVKEELAIPNGYSQTISGGDIEAVEVSKLEDDGELRRRRLVNGQR